MQSLAINQWDACYIHPVLLIKSSRCVNSFLICSVENYIMLQWIGWRENRKPWIYPWNIVLSCKSALQPIQFYERLLVCNNYAMSSLIENCPLFVGSRLSRPVPHLTVIGLRPQLPHCSCDFWHFSTRPRGTQKHEVRWHCIAVGDHKISKFSVSSVLVLCFTQKLLFPFCFGPVDVLKNSFAS